MLAGCSSTLLSPRHRLRTEASSQFQACHFPSMSTQRLDLPCGGFPRKDNSRSQSIRPVGISVEKQSIRLPPLAATTTVQPPPQGRRENRDGFWEKNRSLKKRFADSGSSDDDESSMNRAKRQKGGSGKSDDLPEREEGILRLGQLGSGNFWFQPQVPLCFVPNSHFGSAGNELTGFETRRGLPKELSGGGGGGSTTSSENTTTTTHSLGLRLNGNTSEHKNGNGSSPSNPHRAREIASGGNNNGEHGEFELISFLVACVEAIGSRNIGLSNHFIAKLGELASPRGSSPLTRLISYFAEGLALRISRIWPRVFHIAPPREFDRVVDEDAGASIRLLNQATPIPKFIHFTSNEIFLRAFEGKDRVHIIDFDIKQGLQWPSLFQSLASRPNPPSHVRITGIGNSKQELIDTGNRLYGFAEALNLPFEFHPVVDRLEDVRVWMLHVKEQEAVAVNCVMQLHKMLYDDTGTTIRDFLGLIRSTNPEIVLVTEQETDHNEPDLEIRVSNCLKYYSAIFDAIDSTHLPPESPARIKIEEIFGHEIRNIIACEGRERSERHESFTKWKKIMERGGFKSAKITDREVLQSRLLIRMYGSDGYGVEKQEEEVEEEKGGEGLTLSWYEQPLYTVSAWMIKG